MLHSWLSPQPAPPLPSVHHLQAATLLGARSCLNFSAAVSGLCCQQYSCCCWSDAAHGAQRSVLPIVTAAVRCSAKALLLPQLLAPYVSTPPAALSQSTTLFLRPSVYTIQAPKFGPVFIRM